MGKFDFGAAHKAAEKEGYLGGGGYLKLKEGPNRMRLVSEALPHPGEYQGRKTFKWLLYVLDRVDGTVKPFFMPHSISKMVADLQRSDDYGFDGVPLPYDITINAKGAGTKEVEYTVMPARQNTPLTPAEEKLVAEAKPLDEVQQAIYEKGGGTPAEKNIHVPGFDPDLDIPA